MALMNENGSGNVCNHLRTIVPQKNNLQISARPSCLVRLHAIFICHFKLHKQLPVKAGRGGHLVSVVIEFVPGMFVHVETFTRGRHTMREGKQDGVVVRLLGSAPTLVNLHHALLIRKKNKFAEKKSE